MKYFAKKERNRTFFVLIGLFVMIFSMFAGLQAQKSNNQQDSLNADSRALVPAGILVPNGYAAVTSTAQDAGAQTLKVVDITQFGALWTNAANLAPFDSSGSMPLYLSWSPASFQGQTMRGLTIGRGGQFIYVSASPYAGGNRTPNIYRIGPSAATISMFTPLPGSNKYGIGSIDFDAAHNLIFATNVDDGKIYSRDASTGLPGPSVNVFDPLSPDASGANLPPLGERLVAVAYHPLEKRVYYSVWGFNPSNNSGANTIRSVAVNSVGGFIPETDKLEATLASSQVPAGDIEFNLSGKRMLVAEEPMYESTLLGLTAHNGRGLEFVKGTPQWILDPTVYGSGLKYEIGVLSSKKNSRGGAAWGYSSLRTTLQTGTVFNCDETFVLFTGDALRFDTKVVYGLQFVPSTGGSAGGGSVSNSVISDLDYDINQQDKSVYNDVDIRKDRGLQKFVSGSVYDRFGLPLSNVIVTMSFESGYSLTTQTNPYGTYRFDDITAGETVVVRVSAKQYTFMEPMRIITVEEDISDLDFTANE
jgi:hypothetical protein